MAAAAAEPAAALSAAPEPVHVPTKLERDTCAWPGPAELKNDTFHDFVDVRDAERDVPDPNRVVKLCVTGQMRSF